MKIWCASTLLTGTSFFERCCHSPDGFLKILQRGPREREPCFSNVFSTPRRFDLLSTFPCSRRFNFGQWFTNYFIRMGRPYYFQSTNYFSNFWMSILSVFVVVGGAKFSIKRVYEHFANGCFLLQQALRKIRVGYKNIKIIGKNIFRAYRACYLARGLSLSIK